LFKFNSKNIIVAFAPLSRGNFVRTCLTLSPQSADASYKMTSIDDRLNQYIKNTTVPVTPYPPWGPGHMDQFLNFDKKRFMFADPADLYIHGGHYIQIPKYANENSDIKEIVPLINKEFIFITINQDDIDEITSRQHNDTPIHDEFDFFSSVDKITNFVGHNNWYNLPYRDILNKDLFINHCVTINKNCYIDKISNYYNEYYKNNVNDNGRAV
jgi:hypothetical protein